VQIEPKLVQIELQIKTSRALKVTSLSANDCIVSNIDFKLLPSLSSLVTMTVSYSLTKSISDESCALFSLDTPDCLP
jgi:hypothetical protein